MFPARVWRIPGWRRFACFGVGLGLALSGFGCRSLGNGKNPDRSRVPGVNAPPDRPVVDERPPLPLEFVRVPEGRFILGARVEKRPDDPFTDRREDVSRIDWRHALPRRVVHLHAFEIGRYEVTQYQWTQVMGYNPSGATKGLAPQTTENYPVENVSYSEVMKFIAKLNARDKIAGYRYRLPTEAEWEYACGGGVDALFGETDDSARLGYYAWYRANSPRCTHPVGLKLPNRFGLYDMHGNVLEWCSDWYRPSYPPRPKDETRTVLDNPTGPKTGTDHVVRGGAWNLPALQCSTFWRQWAHPKTKTWNLGFRLVRERIPRPARPPRGAGKPRKHKTAGNGKPAAPAPAAGAPGKKHPKKSGTAGRSAGTADSAAVSPEKVAAPPPAVLPAPGAKPGARKTPPRRK